MKNEVELKDNLVALRRRFHQCAEIGWLEFETTFEIIEYLQKLGYNIKYGKSIHHNPMGRDEKLIGLHRERMKKNYKDINMKEVLEGYTGAVAELDTGIPGPTVAFRFDIDGLEGDEGRENHRPFDEGFQSKNLNMFHGCGHDGHIAIGLQLAKTIKEMKNQLCGKVRFIFQPSEEGVRGAESMVAAGVLEGVDYLFSGHVGFISQNNAIGVLVKNMLATNKVEVEFKGKSAHAGLCPEEGKNALLAAASCILNMHSQVQYGEGIARLNVGVLHGGTGKNIIADRAVLELETRGDTNKINDKVMAMVENVVKGTALSFGVEGKVNIVGSARAYNAEENEFTKKVIDELKELKLDIIENYSFGASEDITDMLEEVEKNGGKAMYFIFPSKIAAPHHNPNFDFDEEALVVAHKVYVKMLESICEFRI